MVCNQINNIRDKLISLNLFKTVKVSEDLVDDNYVNLNIYVEEKQINPSRKDIAIHVL